MAKKVKKQFVTKGQLNKKLTAFGNTLSSQISSAVLSTQGSSNAPPAPPPVYDASSTPPLLLNFLFDNWLLIAGVIGVYVYLHRKGGA